MDLISNIEAFVAVVETGSITTAADRMDIAKSAVSRRLSELEEHLGAQLLHRTTRKLSLTEPGRIYLEKARDVLASIESATSAVRSATTELRGPIKIAAPLSFGLSELAPRLEEFGRRHAGLELDVNFDDRHVDLITEGFDLAVRIAKLADSTLRARQLCPVRHCVVASPGYLAKHGTPEHPEDLERHSCLQYTNRPDHRWHYVSPDGKSGAVSVSGALAANNGDFLIQAASRDRGVALQPTFIACTALQRGDVIPILTDYEWPGLHVYAIYPPTRHLTNRVRALVDYLVDEFSQEPGWDRAYRESCSTSQQGE